MLHLIPRPLHRLAFRTAHALRKRWWRIRKPRLSGCRVLAFDSAGCVLLVRHSYGTGNWMAPGGGLRRGEDPLLAGARELLEETGCALERAWHLTLVEESLQGATNMVHIVAGTATGVPVPDAREVIEAAFFAPDALPDRMSDLLRRDLLGWFGVVRGQGRL